MKRKNSDDIDKLFDNMLWDLKYIKLKIITFEK